jgi:hypothetical protein|tara:strand:- start:675 stop:980 length:306 start_codon:yes stop_codon:yes gene_type:complete
MSRNKVIKTSVTPSTLGKAKRNYRKEYDNYHAAPEQKKKRASRNAARGALMTSGSVSKGDGKDVDHKNGNPMDNRGGNLAVKPKSRNRSFPRDKNAKKLRR